MWLWFHKEKAKLHQRTLGTLQGQGWGKGLNIHEEPWTDWPIGRWCWHDKKPQKKTLNRATKRGETTNSHWWQRRWWQNSWRLLKLSPVHVFILANTCSLLTSQSGGTSFVQSDHSSSVLTSDPYQCFFNQILNIFFVSYFNSKFQNQKETFLPVSPVDPSLCCSLLHTQVILAHSK